MIHPASVGPIAGAKIAVAPYAEKARPRLSGGKLSARIACANGFSPPPPIPCSTRDTNKTPRSGAMAQTNELSVKKKMQARKSRLRPNRGRHLLIGSTMAFDTR